MTTPSPLFLLLALASLTLAAGCRKSGAASAVAAAPVPVDVRVAPVERSTATPPILAAGLLARQTEADLSFSTGGVVGRLEVRAGDRVKAGQELARLQLDAVEAQLAQTQAAVAKLRRDLGRIERLQQERAVPLETLQDARTQLEQAEASQRIAEFARRHAVITAPGDGVILRRLAEPNELVAAGRPVVSFASEGEGWIVRAELAAHDAARVEPNSPVEIRAGSAVLAQGRITRIAEAVNPATRTVPVEANLAAPPAGARSGLVVSLVIAPVAVAARPVVPIAALRHGEGNHAALFLLAADGRSVRRIDVEVEEVAGAQAYLRTPLPDDARVVISGAQFLADGSPVTVAPQPVTRP